MNDQEKINLLLQKLDVLLKRQDEFAKEIYNLRVELSQLKATSDSKQANLEKSEFTPPVPVPEVEQINLSVKKENELISTPSTPKTEFIPLKPKIDSQQPKAAKQKSDLEKFIGENLSNKIGIAITVVGVAIGAKYSIDNDLISPLTRIILGYITGLILLAFGIRLKLKYENYSAVLVSGAMAIMYFITYAGYGFYSLFPQVVAFLLMVIFTIFTVIAAINYNMQVIAHIGLVGAYAVPFLLSEGSGKVAVLFSYMAIINTGILVISIRKYWKPLYYTSFGLTWLIFFLWWVTGYQSQTHFVLALTFHFLFFLIFYLIFLGYKLVSKEVFQIVDIILLILNSGIFYGIGYGIIAGHELGMEYLGIFTLFNAIVHFVVGLLIYKKKLADKNLFYLVAGLVLVFITVTIPVQFNGNWVTLIWAGEGVLLFWIGRMKGAAIYEQLCYPLVLLAFLSLTDDWLSSYLLYNMNNPATKITPIFNVYFLSTILVVSGLAFINYIFFHPRFPPSFEFQSELRKLVAIALPTFLLTALYFGIRLEISNYWKIETAESLIPIGVKGEKGYRYFLDNDLRRYGIFWLNNFTLVFVSALALFNLIRIKSRNLALVSLSLIVVALLVFLFQGLYNLSELRESYLHQTLAKYYSRDFWNIGIRYISFALVGLVLAVTYKSIKQDYINYNLRIGFDFLLHTTILWIASSELITWFDVAESTQSYKLGLSILWGVYSLFLVAFGIWRKNKPLRIGAIVLFGVTLLKLFFYDISHLNTLAKTIVFVSLGLFLLVISFLYNKYKHLISEDEMEK